MPENNITLKLFDFLRGKCPYKGCKHNNHTGLCLTDKDDLKMYVARMVETALNINTGRIENLNLVCNSIDVKNGYCESCGNLMSQIHEPRPYGNTNVFEVFYECLNPECK